MARTEGEGQLQNKPPIEFGQPLHKQQRQSELFPEGDDLPLFSGTPQEVIDQPFVPEETIWKQPMLPGMPEIDYDSVRAKDQVLRRRRQAAVPSRMPSGDIFPAAPDLNTANPGAPQHEVTIYPAPVEPPVHAPVLIHGQDKPRKEQRPARKRAEGSPAAQARQLREALAPYLNVPQLRCLASEGRNLHEALRSDNPPKEVLALLATLAAILRPAPREQISSPADVAALLMVEMGHLTQEQLRVVCLTTKNHVQQIHMVYQGSVNTSPVRIAEVFREPIKLNSAGIITAHNHPSGQPDPSPVIWRIGLVGER